MGLFCLTNRFQCRVFVADCLVLWVFFGGCCDGKCVVLVAICLDWHLFVIVYFGCVGCVHAWVLGTLKM